MILPGYRHQHSENNGKCCENHQRELAKLRQREESKVSELLSECEESAALAKIDEMFLTGIVSAANADYWNEKLSAARERHELAEQRYKELISALEPLENQEKLSGFAWFCFEDIQIRAADTLHFRILSLEQYLQVYRKSLQDGYRVHVRQKKDAHKIILIESRLSKQ